MIKPFKKNTAQAWLLGWVAGLALLYGWNAIFLNAPDFAMLFLALWRTLFTSGLAVGVAFFLALIWIHTEEWASRNGYTFFKAGLAQLDDLIRTAPQIIGLLIGYTLMTIAIRSEHLMNPWSILTIMAVTLAVVMMHEWTELFRSRIAYYREKDLIPALRVCGIREGKIINRDILWYNSRTLILHKSVALFGTAFFLQSAMDFIVSVGLTSEIASSNFPATLGSILAKMNSKQDIMAIGIALTDFSMWPSLFTEHLLGISGALVVIWTLIAFFKAADVLGQKIR